MKIYLKLRNLGVTDIGKVNSNDTAHCRGKLIHQSAGLPKKFIFGVLSDFGKFHRGPASLSEKLIEHRANEHLESSR